MKICIPAENDLGMDSRAYDHFGSAPFFIIADTGTGACEAVSNQHDHQEHGQCAPMSRLGAHELDGVVCKGMGRNALARFASAGVRVYMTNSQTVGEIIEEARNGRLQPLDADRACPGHGGSFS